MTKDDVVSLSGVMEFEVSDEFEISSFSADELDIVSSFYKQKFDTTDKLRKRFKRVSGVMMDTTKNSHGFSVSTKGLKSMETHFNATKNSKVLHRKFIDHKFQDIEKQIGKLTKIWYDDKTQELKYNGVDDKKHPVTDRVDSFNSVSTTIAHGDRSCSACGKAFRGKYTQDCNCKDMHPVSNRAMNIELSYVSFPAYDGTSVNVDSFSGDIQKEIKIFLGDEPTPPEFADLLSSEINPENANVITMSDMSGNSLSFDMKKGDIYWNKTDTEQVYWIKNYQDVSSNADPDPPVIDESDEPPVTKNKISEAVLKDLIGLTKEVKSLRDELKR